MVVMILHTGKRVSVDGFFAVASAAVVLLAVTTGVLAGPKLVVTLEEGTGLSGGPVPDISGATVSATALLSENQSTAVTTVGITAANGKVVLEVPHSGAYAIEIQLEGSTGPTYWTSRRVLLEGETELIPGEALSGDEFSPIRDFTQVSCGTAVQGADAHPIREILLGRISVLRTEINLHRNTADTLATTQLGEAPFRLRKDITTALSTNGTTAEIFHALTPIRQRSRLSDRGSDTTVYASVVEKIWLLYFLAARATADLDTLYTNLQECGGSVIAEELEADDPPVTQTQVTPDTPVTPKQNRSTAPANTGRKPARPALQPKRTPTIPAAAEEISADWAGLYVGAHAGAGFADAGYRAGVAGPGIPIGIDADGFLSGLLLGYNLQHDQFVFGLEGDISFGNISGRNTLTGASDPRLETDYIVTARARIGYAWERTLLYGQIGIGIAKTQIEDSLQLAAPTQTHNTHVGVVVGGGVEWALTDTVRLRTEYIYGNFDRRDYTIGPVTDSLAFDVHIARAAISVKLGPLP